MKPPDPDKRHRTNRCHAAQLTNGKWAIVHPGSGAAGAEPGEQTGAHYETQRAAANALAAHRKDLLSDETP